MQLEIGKIYNGKVKGITQYGAFVDIDGGGTGMVGDPSGRTDMRQMMTPETIQHNCDQFKKLFDKFKMLNTMRVSHSYLCLSLSESC